MVELNEIFVDLLPLECQKMKGTETSERGELFLGMAAMGNLKCEEFE